MGKLATKVHKCNKRGIDIHFLNQQPRVNINLKVSGFSLVKRSPFALRLSL